MHYQTNPLATSHLAGRRHETSNRITAHFRRYAGWVGVLLLLSNCPGSSAALLAYEGFDYPPDTTIAGQTDGSGWSTAWGAGATAFEIATNQAPSLTYIDLSGNTTLLTAGGSLVVGNPNGPTAPTVFPYRALNNNLSGGTGTTAGPGGTVWISLLYQRLNLEAGGAPYFVQANLGLCEGFLERLAVGGPNTSATVSNVFSVWGSGAAHDESAPFQSAVHPLLPASTTFILIKVVTDGTAAADSAYVWFNPTNLTVEPNNATADLTDNEVNLSAVNTLWLWAAGYDVTGTNAAFQVDELRLGTTFADVTPTVLYGAEPAILDDPEDLILFAGQPASFMVTAVGSAPLAYQWFFNTNTALPNATNATYTIANTVLGDTGGYSVVVTNSSGAVTSAVATLTVEVPIPPQITTQPQSLTRPIGSPMLFSVTATGSAPLHYQWYYNTNTPLANQTDDTLSFTITSTNDSGGYSVIVTNNYGAVTSSVAQLTAVPPPPAFPGADGAGCFASGGRGGIVYHVTKLDRNFSDTEVGTLRYGLNNANFPPGTARTIVFDVGGTFWLGQYGAERPEYNNGWDARSNYGIPNNITIAGQSAPGPVIIMGGVTKCSGSDVIIRNLTFAAGYGMRGFDEPDKDPPRVPAPGDYPDSYIFEALQVSGHDVMLDHLTTVYATAVAIWFRESASNVSMQYCTVGQGLNYPQGIPGDPGEYGGRAYGMYARAGANAKISILNNLQAHSRGPLVVWHITDGSGPANDFRNNVTYNWLIQAGFTTGDGNSGNNFINNFYLSGPGGDNASGTNIVYAPGHTGIFYGNAQTRTYVSGNLKDTNNNGDPDDTTSADGDYLSTSLEPAAEDVNIGITLDASNGFRNVLHYVGPRWWERDYDIAANNTNSIDTLDERLIHETWTGTGKVMAWADDPFDNSPSEGVEWRAMLALRADSNTFAAPFEWPVNWDTDQDGMPDTWETEHGLNPNVANNNADFDNDLYTDLEEYLNEIAAWPAPGTIYFTGEQDNRYAPIFNWRVYGVNVNISGIGNLPSSSLWQPSRYDTAVISNQTVFVDAVGQHAGELKLMSSAALNITNGWLKVATRFENSAGCTTTVSGPGALTTSNLLNSGMLRLTGAAGLNVSGTFTNTGTIDIMSWNGSLPGGLVNLGTILDGGLIVITDYEVSGADVIVTIEGYTGHEYQLQFRDDLASSSWENVGTAIDGANNPIQFTHTNGAASQQRFYRVLVD